MENVAKPMPLADYLKIFNFISKVAFYSTNGHSDSKLTNPLGALRKECCTDMIDRDINFTKISRILDRVDYKMKYLDMYSKQINDKYIVSVVIINTEPENPEIINPIVYANDILFDDDIKHIYALIDYRMFKANGESSCADYFESIFNGIMTEICGENLYEDDESERNRIAADLPIETRVPMRTLNILFANLLYKDSTKHVSDGKFMNAINLTIDKLMGIGADETDYISMNIDKLEDIRTVLTDFIDLQYYQD